MDAIEYFLTYSTLFVAMIGIAFFLVGTLFGTLLSSRLRSELRECRDSLADCQTSSAKLKSELAELKKQSSLAGSFTPSTSPATNETQKEKEPANQEQPQSVPSPESDDPFTDLIASGTMTRDEKLGAVYSNAPADPDDLTKIKGVGKSINTKLNKAGIYKFEQIAQWTEPVCQEFATRLAFKDRILREDWPSQAKSLQNKS